MYMYLVGKILQIFDGFDNVILLSYIIIIGKEHTNIYSFCGPLVF